MLHNIVPYLPQDELAKDFKKESVLSDVSVPREVSGPIITKLREVWNDSEATYRAHAAALDNAHQILAHQTDLRFGTLDKIAAKLLGPGVPLAPAALVAVRRALSRKTLLFGYDVRSVRTTRVFLIHPHQMINSLHEVAGWIRDYQEAEAKGAAHQDLGGVNSGTFKGHSAGGKKIQQFIQKAKRLVQNSRHHRGMEPKIGAIGPSKLRRPVSDTSESVLVKRGVPFDDSERAIIKFLFTSCLTKMFKKEGRYFALSVQLVRATGEYGIAEEVQRPHIYALLIEIGAILPYENPFLHNENLLLPNSQRSKPLERLRDTINRDDPTATFPDSMKALRRDWKGLPVYCIDNASTENVDDGISLERVRGSPDEYWIHVHVANPTARINKDSDIARMAAHMTNTLYAPDDHYWLLPHWISQRFLSLAPDRPVLTFSARLDKNGNILQTQIQPGIVRNVIRMTYAGINETLKLEEKAGSQTFLSVGLSPEVLEKMRAPAPSMKVTVGQREDLNVLLRLAKARSTYRFKNGGLTFRFPDTNVSACSTLRKDAGNLASKIPLLSESAHIVEGDPGISLAAREWPGYFKMQENTYSSDLVMEMMLLAGEVGARWCSERNIPVVYRGMFASVLRGRGQDITTETFWNEVMNPGLQKDGQVPEFYANAYVALAGRVGSALTPVKHTSLGLSHYTKVTTPLGRYSDMIAHWQIESALREEARTGKSLKGSKREDYLAFTSAELGPVVPRLRAREYMLNAAKVHSNQFWISQLLFRAWHHKEAELPETFEVVVTSDAHWLGRHVTATWKQFAIVTKMNITPEKHADKTKDEPYARLGDHWEARISEVRPYTADIYLEPVRLLHREEHSLDEILDQLRGRP